MVAAQRSNPVAATAPPKAQAAAWTAELLAALGALPADADQRTDQRAEDPLASALLATVRRRGQEGLASHPLPARREEAWRFTDTASIAAIAPRLLGSAGSGGEAPAALSRPPVAADTLRLVLDGHSDPLAGVRLPDGLTPLGGSELEHALGHTLAATDCREHWPVLLNKASTERLLALRVSGPVLPVLELVSDAAGAEGVLPLRILLVLEDRASLELLQVHRSAGANLTSVVLEARLGEGAELRHSVLARGGEGSVLLAHLAVEQAPGSRYALHSACGGWDLARLEPRIIQTDGAATTRLRGLQVVNGRQIADTHSQVHFGGPEGDLDQLHKAVADGAGRSVFNGAVRVPRLAQRTNAVQMSRNLLLSERARIDTKPELEIVADDVKCAHGATVSRLQLDELFYLQSRGIAAEQAARLLLRGFCEEVLREFPAAAAVWQPLQGLLGLEDAGR
jgi:FeS assembly protein SufD